MDDWTTHPAAARLLGVHALLRRDLAATRSTLAALTNGRASLSQTRDVVAGLGIADPSGAFRMQCLSTCEFVRTHHLLEDQIFPQLAALEHELAPVIERLMREHEEVAEILDGLQLELGRDAPSILDVQRDLADLADHLEAHLEYEEAHIGPALARLA